MFPFFLSDFLPSKTVLWLWFALLGALLWGSISPVAYAVEYGGIGGRPAYPRADTPRSESIFIHTLESGASTTDGIQVINNSNKEVSLQIYAADSVTSTDGGFACRQQGEAKEKVGQWIQFETEQVTLSANQSLIVPFTISVPEQADVGEHNGCVLMQERASNVSGGAGISLSVRTGIRVAVTVPGELVRELVLDDLLVQERADGSWILSTIFENTGNVSVDTTAKLFVRSLIGPTDDELTSTFPVLRGDTARWNFELSPRFWGGWYWVTTEATYATFGGERQTLTGRTVSFFAWPTSLAMLVYCFGLGLVVLIIGFVIFRRQRARWIDETWTSYSVKDGDAIESVANQYRVSWKLLAKVNKLKPPYNIADLILRVPPVATLPKVKKKKQLFKKQK